MVISEICGGFGFKLSMLSCIDVKETSGYRLTLSLYFQALQLGQDSYSPFEQRSQRCQMCLRSDLLHKVMERLANPGEFITFTS